MCAVVKCYFVDFICKAKTCGLCKRGHQVLALVYVGFNNLYILLKYDYNTLYYEIIAKYRVFKRTRGRSLEKNRHNYQVRLRKIFFYNEI